MLRESVAACREALGAAHESTLGALSNLAALLKQQARGAGSRRKPAGLGRENSGIRGFT